jgi:ribosomal-protein-alanine N-acetyltransferase
MSRPPLSDRVRQAVRSDAAALQRLLRDAAFVHLHADWHLPGDWLGEEGFVLHMEPPGRPLSPPGLDGCLVIAADPLPAAWVRVAATRPEDGFPLLLDMLDAVLPELDPRINEIAWFVTDEWPEPWLEGLGFDLVTDVITFEKDDLRLAPYRPPAGLEIRPVRMDDFPVLAEIEAAAFEPMWRHSAEGLVLAWRQSVLFDVALVDGQPAGFQFSTRTYGGAHLARMTVRPDMQGQGIGASLLAEAIAQFEAKNLRRISLNTQRDNLISQRLYKRFGFVESGQAFPVWARGR